MNRALAKLPEDFRSAVLLVDVEEFTYEEAAAALECPVGTLRSRQVATKPAPLELRENILRALEADAASATMSTVRRNFQKPRWKPILAWATVLMGLGILALILIPKQRNIPQVVARDFRSYQRQKLALEVNTAAVKKLQAFFTDQSLRFTPHVYDLSEMGYRLVGGRVQDLRGQRTEWVAYRGTNNQALVCQMHVGKVSELPAGSVEREHRGKKVLRPPSERPNYGFLAGPQDGLRADVRHTSRNVVQLAFAKATPPST